MSPDFNTLAPNTKIVHCLDIGCIDYVEVYDVVLKLVDDVRMISLKPLTAVGLHGLCLTWPGKYRWQGCSGI